MKEIFDTIHTEQWNENTITPTYTIITYCIRLYHKTAIMITEDHTNTNRAIKHYKTQDIWNFNSLHYYMHSYNSKSSKYQF